MMPSPGTPREDLEDHEESTLSDALSSLGEAYSDEVRVSPEEKRALQALKTAIQSVDIKLQKEVCVILKLHSTQCIHEGLQSEDNGYSKSRKEFLAGITRDRLTKLLSDSGAVDTIWRAYQAVPSEIVDECLAQQAEETQETLRSPENLLLTEQETEDVIVAAKKWSDEALSRLNAIELAVSHIDVTLYNRWKRGTPDIEKKFEKVMEAGQTLLQPEHQASARYYAEKTRVMPLIRKFDEELHAIASALRQQNQQLSIDQQVCQFHITAMNHEINEGRDIEEGEAKKTLETLKQRQKAIDEKIKKTNEQVTRLEVMQTKLNREQGLWNDASDIAAGYPLEMRPKILSQAQATYHEVDDVTAYLKAATQPQDAAFNPYKKEEMREGAKGANYDLVPAIKGSRATRLTFNTTFGEYLQTSSKLDGLKSGGNSALFQPVSTPQNVSLHPLQEKQAAHRAAVEAARVEEALSENREREIQEWLKNIEPNKSPPLPTGGVELSRRGPQTPSGGVQISGAESHSRGGVHIFSGGAPHPAPWQGMQLSRKPGVAHEPEPDNHPSERDKLEDAQTVRSEELAVPPGKATEVRSSEASGEGAQAVDFSIGAGGDAFDFNQVAAATPASEAPDCFMVKQYPDPNDPEACASFAAALMLDFITTLSRPPTVDDPIVLFTTPADKEHAMYLVVAAREMAEAAGWPSGALRILGEPPNGDEKEVHRACRDTYVFKEAVRQAAALCEAKFIPNEKLNRLTTRLEGMSAAMTTLGEKVSEAIKSGRSSSEITVEMRECLEEERAGRSSKEDDASSSLSDIESESPDPSPRQ